jgi:hypothetical protein
LYFNLNIQAYNYIIENIIEEQDLIKQYYNLIQQRYKENSSLGGTINGEINGYSDEEKEIEFRRVFDNFYKEHGVYPTRRIFNKLSKYSDMTYRRKSKRSWNETVKHYGYPITNKNVSETVCLNYISNILNTKYIQYKTWDWLLGIQKGHMFCDGYYPEYNLVIEFDGKSHRSPIYGEDKFKLQQQNDQLKNILLPQHNIKVIRIDSRKPWDDIQYLKQILYDNNILLNVS